MNIEQIQVENTIFTKLTEEVKRATFSDLMIYANSQQIKIRDPNSTTTQSRSFNKYTKDQIITYLQNPANYETQLRNMSNYLCNISSHYRRLIEYFADMLTFPYIVTPLGLDQGNVDTEKFKTQYLKVNKQLEIMNFKHEFNKVLQTAYKDDVFYGYVYETKDSFTIQQLDPAYCRITSIYDGVYCFAWDSSFFSGREDLLEMYADEFTTAYNQYRANTSMRWFELDPRKIICIKINETTLTPVPPFVSLFSILADIEDYRAITKNASEASNYKVLTLKIPVDKEGQLLLPLPLCKEFYRALSEQLPKNIGIALTPMEVDDWRFENSGALKENDIVARAEDMFWRGAGVNGLLFGLGDNPSSSALEISIVPDEAMAFRVLRQLERWVNARVKHISGTYKFQVKFLDVTKFNESKMLDMYMKLGQYGNPIRLPLMAIAGYKPTEIDDMAFLENTVLELYKKEIPLQSSNTMSGEVGRPTNESKGKSLTDNGEKSKESNGNSEN